MTKRKSKGMGDGFSNRQLLGSSSVFGFGVGWDPILDCGNCRGWGFAPCSVSAGTLSNKTRWDKCH